MTKKSDKRYEREMKLSVDIQKEALKTFKSLNILIDKVVKLLESMSKI